MAMHVYARGGVVVAVHNEEQRVPATAYGDEVSIYAVAEGEMFEPGDQLPAFEADTADLTRSLAIDRVCGLANMRGRQLAGNVPDDEKASWPIKAQEAAAWQADNGSATPILDAEIIITGESKADLVARILVLSAAYKVAAGSIAGIRRSAETAIAAAIDAAEVEAAVVAAETALNAIDMGLP